MTDIDKVGVITTAFLLLLILLILSLGVIVSKKSVQVDVDPQRPETLSIETLGPGHPFWYISMCESGQRQFNDEGEVLRGELNPADIGIMQINEDFHKEEIEASGLDIYTEDGNIRFAMYLWMDQGLSPWWASENCWKPLFLSELGERVYQYPQK